ncbi:MAG TPA: hypothetical protein VGK00_06820 [Anaerolineales bacterium]
MKPKIRFFALTIVVVLIVGIFLTLRAKEEEEKAAAEHEFPTALGKHIEELSKTIPGRGGEPGEGPGSYEDQKFEMLAYPGEDIPVTALNAERSAALAIDKHRLPTGKGKPGSWVTIGPSSALYPATQFRNSYSYVPAAYNAGGRTVAIAIAPLCVEDNCRLWIATAGGGVWRTDNALAGQPNWKYLSGPFGINAAGSIALDPNDPSGNTIYVGTGEANICGSGCVAGVGLYKSTNGGDSWTGPLGSSELGNKGIGSIVVKPGDPNTLYVGTTSALRGMSSTCCSGVTRPVPGAAKWGLYKSTNGGSSWTFIHNGSTDASSCTGSNAEFNNAAVCSPRGVRQVLLDPSNSSIVYASSYARGVWRSSDEGATWIQINPSLNPAITQTRPAFAVAALPNGKTRMYIFEGNTGSPYARLFRSDDVASGTPAFAMLTSNNPADPGFATFNLCGGQCWYDLFVYSPKNYPDIVYIGGSYAYGEPLSNKRAVILSTDAGVSGTDMTMDATDQLHPNGLHPDQHFLVTNPNNPYQFFESNDGGIMRSSGVFADVSAWCDDPNRGLGGAELDRCRQLLSRVPTTLASMNKGLTTLQFMSLSVSPFNSNILQGGTQDNGTWQTIGNPSKWENKMIGDGGQSGFDVGNPDFRFHTFFDASPDVNFSGGDIADWNWIADPIFGTGAQFYSPIITDPKVSKTMFVGTSNAWRTKTWGMGNMTLTEFRQHCNEWFGDFSIQCGDWEPIANPRLNSSALGDRAGGSVVAIERALSDTSTAWAATQTGRVFISKNVDADPAAAVTWTRLDVLASNDPNRFVTSIFIDPANPNHAWLSYSGFNAITPALTGHVFEVTFNPSAGTATWADRSFDLGDVPVTDLVLDSFSGDLYASSDFGVYRLAAGTTTWVPAAPGMPKVEVAGLAVVPGDRKLFAATHGLGAWQLNLP